MKKIVQQYEALIQKIQAGEEVSFGQMERVFAPAFLENFLRRILGGRERERIRELHKKTLASRLSEYDDDINPESLELSSQELLRQEIELVRMVTGTLGVRPSAHELQPYIQEALRVRNWQLVSDVLSLSQEGKIEHGTIERAALDDLVQGRTESYKELRKAFPEVQFTRERVTPAYESIVRSGEFERLKILKAETGVPIPERCINEAYSNLLHDFGIMAADTSSFHARQYNEKIDAHIEHIRQFQESIGMPLPTSLEHYRKIAQAIASGELESAHMDALNALFAISSNFLLTGEVQETALARGNLPAFLAFYSKTPHKIPSERISTAEEKLYQQRMTKECIDLMKETRVAPPENTWKALCSQLLQQGDFETIERITQATRQQPHFEREISEAGLRTHTHNLESFQKYAHFLQKQGATISSEAFASALSEYVQYRIRNRVFSSTTDIASLRSLYEERGLKQPQELVELQIRGAVSELEKKMYLQETEKSKKYADRAISPLSPEKRTNIKEYHAFARAATAACKECLNTVKQLKKEHPEIAVSASTCNFYAPVLELMLVQASQGEKLLPLHELIQETGIAPSPEAYQEALARHLTKARTIPQHPNVMLERIAQETGITMRVSDNDKEKIVAKVLESEPPYRVPERIAYAKELLGEFQITPQLHYDMSMTAVRNLIDGNAREYRALVSYTGGAQALSQTYRAVIQIKACEALEKMNLSRYDFLKENAGFPFMFDEQDKQRVQRTVIEMLVNDPSQHANVKKINERVGFQITATPQELKQIINAYFGRDAWNRSPQEIAKSLNQQLDQDLIRSRIIELARDERLNDWCAKELIKNTGIAPLPAQLDTHVVNAGNLESKVEYVRRFIELSPAYKPDARLVREIYIEAYEEEKMGLVNTLLDVTKQLPPPQVVSGILQKSWEITLQKGDRFNWTIDPLAKKLVKKYNAASLYDPAELKRNILQDTGYLLEYLYRKVERANEVHQLTLEFNVAEQEKLLQRLDTHVRDAAYSPLKRDLSVDLMNRARTYASKVFTEQSVREQAAQRAAELFGSQRGNLYQGFAYATLTGILPEFTLQQYEQYKNNLQARGYQLRKGDFEYLKKTLEAWKPEEA